MRRAEQPIVASLLATAGDVVFVGEPSGHLNALDARTGERLWRFQTGNGIHSNPVTYSVNGKQYVAVPAGWGGWLEGFAPEMFGAPRGTAPAVRFSRAGNVPGCPRSTARREPNVRFTCRAPRDYYPAMR